MRSDHWSNVRRYKKKPNLIWIAGTPIWTYVYGKFYHGGNRHYYGRNFPKWSYIWIHAWKLLHFSSKKSNKMVKLQYIFLSAFHSFSTIFLCLVENTRTAHKAENIEIVPHRNSPWFEPAAFQSQIQRSTNYATYFSKIRTDIHSLVCKLTSIDTCYIGTISGSRIIL